MAEQSVLFWYWRGIWALKLPKKINLFIYRACCEALPTQSNLYKRGVSSSLTCLRCLEGVESIEYAIQECEYAQAERQYSCFSCLLKMAMWKLDYVDIEMLCLIAWMLWGVGFAY